MPVFIIPYYFILCNVYAALYYCVLYNVYIISYRRFYSSGSMDVRSGDLPDEQCAVEYTADNDAKYITLTPSEYLPGATVKQQLGHINLFLIRESSDVRDLSSFIKNFFMEAQAIMRAHVAALGGNALFMYRIRELVLTDGPQKMQAQILLNILGDATEVSFTEDAGSNLVKHSR